MQTKTGEILETTSKHATEKPLSAHTKKQIRFAEILAKGIYSSAEAARQAGYKPSVADKVAYKILGKTREGSDYPVLWDYYEKLRRENLREFDINADNIARELALIAFSDLSRYIDLPRREYERKAILAHDTEVAIYAIESYPERMEAYSAAVEKQRQQDTTGKKKTGPKAPAPKEPTRPTAEQYELYHKYAELSKTQRAELMFWKNYRAGSIRLKNAEEIPEALLPAIAELAETKDGIKLKLHDKISALDKLAKWRKMYAPDVDEDSEARVVTEINLVVNGSKSRLMAEADQDTDQEAEKVA
jgi:Terminase small subunit.